MNYLLDTHTFLWVVFDDEKLSENAKEVIGDEENTLYVSAITYWEIALKYSLGKLELEGVTPEELPEYARMLDITTLPFSEVEASTFYKLPKMSHKDPFDRAIMWQAIQRDLTLISRDKDIKAYQALRLHLLW